MENVSVETGYAQREKPTNPIDYARKLFEKNGISPSPDGELVGLVSDCSQYLAPQDLVRILNAQKRFDGPCTVGEHFGDLGEVVQHYDLRKTLKKIPGYMQTVKQAGLSYGQGLDLLMHLFNGDKYDFSQKDSDLIILTKALGASQGDKSLTKNIAKVKNLMSAGVGGSGMGGSIYSFFITSRLGVPVSEASPLIVNGAEGSYVIGPFNEALKSMLPAHPNPELVVEAFDILNGNGRNYWNAGYYKQFEQLMTFVAPGNGISVDNMLAMFVSASKSTSKRKELECTMSKKEATTESRERYFLPFEGKLECFAQPYVTRRSLNEGQIDLSEIANASYKDWKEVGEDMFVFDPKSQLWYSLGGKLEVPSMEEVLSGRAERIRHRFLPYDISSLSETPFLFHVHPKALDIFVAPDRDSLTRPQLRDHLTKFLTATPSRADYRGVASMLKDAKRKVGTRSYIAHSLGITEFSYPHDLNQLEEMGKKSRDIRDQVLLEFNLDRVLDGDGHIGKFDLVDLMIQDLNRILPKGFGLTLHKAGTNF